MKNTDVSRLIEELKRQPERFFDEGRSYDLLQEYFKGLSINSLEELLAHRKLVVRRVAVWIVSELGNMAIIVAKHVLALLDDDDRYVKYYVLESIMVFSSSGMQGVFHHIVSALEHQDAVIRKLGMYLISNASVTQIEEAIEYYSIADNKIHLRGLRVLLGSADLMPDSQINQMLYSESGISAMYGAISLKRCTQGNDRKVSFDSSQVDDETTKMFLGEFVTTE